jgi:solute carrier family 25 (mitochondrial folate transporter), member 32
MLSTSSAHKGAYSSIVDGFQQIYKSDGLRGFYRGLVPSFLGVSHGALQFMAYEQMKKFRLKAAGNGPKDLGNFDYLLFSALSKILAGSASYPYQVVRSRLQIYDAEKQYKGVGNAVVQIWQREGMAGFYKGLGPNLLRVVPSSCVTFLAYENAKRYLPRLPEMLQGAREDRPL